MDANIALIQAGSPSLGLRACVCTDRIQETGDVVTFVFRMTDGGVFDFLAGQFVTIRFSWGDQTYARVFTIASPPTRPDHIALTIKAAADGKATRILHDHFAEGSAVEISAAAGAFTLEGRAVEKALFLCAGSGITPLMSMVRALHDDGKSLDVAFIQCARSPNDILFDHELRVLCQSMPKLRAETVCSQASGFPDHRVIGRLDMARLARLVPDATERTVFLCGPAGFMQAMRRYLVELGVPPGQIFEEAFGAAPSTTSKAPSTRISVAFERSGVRCDADNNATILDLAEARGIFIDTSCRMGVCGTCKIKLLDGEVGMNDMGGLSDMERQDGFVLACCSTPRGDIAVDL